MPQNPHQAVQSPLLANNINARFQLTRADFTLALELELPSNGITAITGRSGSGKTTLLRCIAGLEGAAKGRFSLNGQQWQSKDFFLPPHQRPVGYVFQEASLFPHLSAKDNLGFAVKRADKPVTDSFYRQVVEMMGIEGILSQHPHQLSGGERQRVAIARALLIQPQLLLMDEPLASLDRERKQEILPYLERLRESFDLPILYVSHALDEVARLADYVVMLDQGQIAAKGSVSQVFSRTDLPLNIGEDTSVVLEGTVTERDPKWHLIRVALAAGELWIRDNGEAIGQTVRVCILAKDISLTLTPHTDSSILNRLAVEVVSVTNDQDQAMALVQLHTGADTLIARLTQKSTHQLQLKPGKKLWAQIKSVAIVH